MGCVKVIGSYPLVHAEQRLLRIAPAISWPVRSQDQYYALQAAHCLRLHLDAGARVCPQMLDDVTALPAIPLSLSTLLALMR